MKIIASIIDESNNKEILAEWHSLEALDDITCEWEPCELDIGGAKYLVNASFTNDSRNLSVDIKEKIRGHVYCIILNREFKSEVQFII